MPIYPEFECNQLIYAEIMIIKCRIIFYMLKTAELGKVVFTSLPFPLQLFLLRGRPLPFKSSF